MAVHGKDKNYVFVPSSIHGNGVQMIEKYSGDMTSSNGSEKSTQYLFYTRYQEYQLNGRRRCF